MPNYTPYGNKKTLPNRKTRKGLRNTAFMKNKKVARTQRELLAEKRRELAELMQAESPSPLETSF